MHMTMTEAEAAIANRLTALGIADAAEIAWASVWLEACGYPGLSLLAEALADPPADLAITRDVLGIDVAQRSCALLAPAIMRDVKANGRAYLRNVRHGLFLLPFTVKANIGIGCPVDPAFAVGGERHKNPYGEKLAIAETNGLDVSDDIWASLSPQPN